jgi:hypothetical protein
VHPQGSISPVEEFGRELGEQERRKSVVKAGGTASTAEPETKGKRKRVASPEKKKRPWSFIWKMGDKKVLSYLYLCLVLEIWMRSNRSSSVTRDRNSPGPRALLLTPQRYHCRRQRN